MCAVLLEVKMSEIKVSIIVPVYNVEKFLPECLDSLINQTLKDIEIICINDGSKDNSLAILKNYAQKDSRIKIIDQQNQGQSVARNNGINTAVGEYIGFVDSDDWVDKDYFEKLYLAAKKYDSDIAAGDFIRCGKRIKSKKLQYTNEAFYTNITDKIQYAEIPKYNYIWNKIYKRDSLLKLNMPFPEGRVYEDVYWLVRVVYGLNGFVTVPETYYNYRKNSGSTVTLKSAKVMKDCIYSEKEMLKFFEDNNIPIKVNYKYVKREKIKLFGIDVMKIYYYYPNIKKYKLFGFINILTIEKQGF